MAELDHYLRELNAGCATAEATPGLSLGEPLLRLMQACVRPAGRVSRRLSPPLVQPTSSRFGNVPDRITLPSSGTLAAVTYDEHTATLDVEFRKGQSYRYFMVPASVLRGLVDAPSAGHFYTSTVRGRFQEQRLD
ncbi:MAG: KTSC domain-containing protein [Actinobacteria bacterium]|nr:KTSC domain-containing protein [Actinomycetota bacterium]